MPSSTKGNLSLEQARLYYLAYHELCHAVMAATLGFRVYNVVVEHTRTQRKGRTSTVSFPEAEVSLSEIMVYLAGPAGTYITTRDLRFQAIAEYVRSVPLLLACHIDGSDWSNINGIIKKLTGKRSTKVKLVKQLFEEILVFFLLPATQKVVEAHLLELMSTGTLSAKSLFKLHEAALKLRAPVKEWNLPKLRKHNLEHTERYINEERS